MENNYKFVDFERYCKLCKHINVKDADGDEPCNSCLTECINLESEKPVKFEGVTEDGE